MPKLQGSPAPFDEFLKPFIRGVEIVLSLLGSGLAWWLTPMWFWPLPAALVICGFEILLWKRGNRIYELSLCEEAVRFYCSGTGQEITLTTSDIRHLNLYYLDSGHSRHRVLCVLRTDRSEVGFQLECESTPTWEDADIPVDLITALFGGNPALLRAMVPRDRIIGQVIRDPDCTGLDWIRRHLRPLTEDAASARVWKGLSPNLDENGMHTDKPDGLLCAGPTAWTGPGGPISFEPGEMGVTERHIHHKGEGEPGTLSLPLLVLSLNESQSLCFPAPALPSWWDKKKQTDEESLHTHLAEGVAIFWAYLRHCPQLPPELASALTELDGLIGPVPEALRRHLNSN